MQPPRSAQAALKQAAACISGLIETYNLPQSASWPPDTPLPAPLQGALLTALNAVQDVQWPNTEHFVYGLLNTLLNDAGGTSRVTWGSIQVLGPTLVEGLRDLLESTADAPERLRSPTRVMVTKRVQERTAQPRRLHQGRE